MIAWSSFRRVLGLPKPRSRTRPEVSRVTEGAAEQCPGALAHLTYLTCALDEVPADQRAAQAQESLVHVGQPLIAHLQPPVAVQPRQCPFGYPPRWRPKRSLESSPRRAMRGAMPRWRKASRQWSKS